MPGSCSLHERWWCITPIRRTERFKRAFSEREKHICIYFSHSRRLSCRSAVLVVLGRLASLTRPSATELPPGMMVGGWASKVPPRAAGFTSCSTSEKSLRASKQPCNPRGMSRAAAVSHCQARRQPLQDGRSYEALMISTSLRASTLVIITRSREAGNQRKRHGIRSMPSGCGAPATLQPALPPGSIPSSRHSGTTLFCALGEGPMEGDEAPPVAGSCCSSRRSLGALAAAAVATAAFGGELERCPPAADAASVAKEGGVGRGPGIMGGRGGGSRAPALAARIRDGGVLRSPAWGGGGGSLSPLGPLVPAKQDQGELNFPPWLEGEWVATSTFDSFRTPLGADLAPPDMAQAAQKPPDEGGLGSEVSYRLRFLPVKDGSRAARTASDRAFNTRSAFNARALKFRGYEPVDNVDYSPAAPDRLTVNFSTVGPGGRPLPSRKMELYITGRQGVAASSDSHQQQEYGSGVGSSSSVLEGARAGNAADVTFWAQELYRQVLLAPGRTDASDYEVLWEYTLAGEGLVTAKQRTAYYLNPNDDAYFDARGGSIAIYDYDVVFTRV